MLRINNCPPAVTSLTFPLAVLLIIELCLMELTEIEMKEENVRLGPGNPRAEDLQFVI